MSPHEARQRSIIDALDLARYEQDTEHSALRLAAQELEARAANWEQAAATDLRAAPTTPLSVATARAYRAAAAQIRGLLPADQQR